MATIIRQAYIDKIEKYLGKETIIVLVGQRRVGKSYIMKTVRDQKASNPDNNIIYINKEKREFDSIRNYQDLNQYIDEHFVASKHNYILIDEIQDITEFERSIRSFRTEPNTDIIITGSNAKMLSSDVATTLGGRYITKHILPYSFSEYLSANNIPYDDMNIATTSGRADVQRYFAEYFRFGGFPEGAQLASKRDYLNSVYQKIYIGDIATRNKIDNLFSLRILFRKMAESVKQPTSFTRLSNIIASTGAKLGKATIINYIEYSKDAFLIYPIKNIADNLTNRETNPKYYFVDNGIISILALDIDTSLLENMVAMELIRRYGIDERVFFYNRNIEVDFYIPDAALAIQVSYNPHKTDETWQRESTALIKFTKVLDCQRLLILSYDTEETVEVNGKTIEVMPVWKWLIQDLSKIF